MENFVWMLCVFVVPYFGAYNVGATVAGARDVGAPAVGAYGVGTRDAGTYGFDVHGIGATMLALTAINLIINVD